MGGAFSRKKYARAASDPSEITQADLASFRGVALWLAEDADDATKSKQRNNKVEKALNAAAKGFVKHASGKATGNWPLPTVLLDDVVKYGEMVQSVYDTLQTKDTESQFFGLCRKGAIEPGEQLGSYAPPPTQQPAHSVPPMPSTPPEPTTKWPVIVLQPNSQARKYTVVTRIEADSGAYKLVRNKGRNYVGYIAEGPPDDDGGVDIAVVFRGTITKSEWYQDAKALQVPWNNGRPVVQLTSTSLQGWPVGFGLSLVLPTWLGLVALSAWSTRVRGAVLAVGDSPQLGWATELVSQVFAPFGDALAWLVGGDSLGGHGLHVSSASFIAGLAAGTITGTWRAAAAYPVQQGDLSSSGRKPWGVGQWMGELLHLAAVLPSWALWGFANVFGAYRDVSQEPHVSYGFKEMYADAQVSASDRSRSAPVQAPPKNATAPAACERFKSIVEHLTEVEGDSPSPRLTVLATLAWLLEDYRGDRANGGNRYIKSVTVAGHSLGGALASLCAWDVADTFSQVAGSNHTASREEGLYAHVDRQRLKIKEELDSLEKTNIKLPAVAAVTWASPRVGDQVYASAFDGCTLVNPGNVPVKGRLRALWHKFLYWGRRLQLKLGMRWLSALHAWINAAWLFGAVPKLAALSRYSAIKAVVLLTGALALDNVIVMGVRCCPSIVSAVGSCLRGNQKRVHKRKVRPTMLRVVDAPDIVPQLPLSLPLTRLFAYAHGGHELRVNYQYIKYFLDVHPWTKPVELARWHNLEMYMHLVDPQRSRALANRTERVLAQGEKVPGAWWSPVPNNGMVTGDGGETWAKHE